MIAIINSIWQQIINYFDIENQDEFEMLVCDFIEMID